MGYPGGNSVWFPLPMADTGPKEFSTIDILFLFPFFFSLYFVLIILFLLAFWSFWVTKTGLWVSGAKGWWGNKV